ncbi:hypothetical protein BKA82DRAFT_535491 [Pisolithus tinctorius]|uniref:DUF6533 domain-containing protein n=1 Tax=Pisolithus tinctorius Marx 270 TaxID=870435 RepID=A0A0C3PBW1_PISTI|nr:hypothetical protein BKA82DRAFT_535491 [Pisolithus tinctorius]KIO05194.1 hypothetical protein M404DRAFT_535491 [Pisolithus tinctorius Marx 270]
MSSLDHRQVSKSSPALFIYDYALTFSKEIDLFWRQGRQTWAFAFFIANRYIGVLGRIPEFFWIFFPNSSGLDNSVCSDLYLSAQIFVVVLQVIGSAIMIGRVYAFYNRDRRVLSLLAVVGMICIGVSSWALSYRPPPSPSKKIATVEVTRAGCPNPVTSVEASHLAAAWGGQLLVDALVFILTLRQLIHSHSLGKGTFVALSLRDGAIYFAVMMAANVANITTYLVVTDPFERSMLSTPTNVLCVVMISRLMINLRNLERKLTAELPE